MRFAHVCTDCGDTYTTTDPRRRLHPRCTRCQGEYQRRERLRPNRPDVWSPR